MVRLEGLSLAYSAPGGWLPAIQDIDLELTAGRIHALIGSSGCGKTSLLRAIAGLVPPTAGRILVEGEELRGIRRGTAIIFQDFGLLPWKTVLANAELPLRLRGLGARARRSAVLPLLEELGLADFLGLYPAMLSGGMQQRLAIVRALSTAPDLLLMDEPFSSLDAMTRESLQETLSAVHSRHRSTILIVTHSIEEAAYLADTVTIMEGRTPGRIGAQRLTENPHCGPAWRRSPAFFAITAALRADLESQP